MKPFFSYNFDDKHFVRRVAFYLRKQRDIAPFCYDDVPHENSWVRVVGKAIDDSDGFVLFLGPQLGKTQDEEIELAVKRRKESEAAGREYKVLRVDLPGAARLPGELNFFNTKCHVLAAAGLGEAEARDCAHEVATSLGAAWVPPDDLPLSYQFDYEKDIIAAYSRGELPGKLIEAGCPREWPAVTRRVGDAENLVPEDEIGLFGDWDHEHGAPRDEEPQVFVAALADYYKGGPGNVRLALPEARPRKRLYYPNRQGGGLTVGVMVSGGIAPGINAVIAGVVERQYLYAARGGYENALTVNGYYNGLDGLIRQGTLPKPLKPDMMKNQNTRGGSMLGTSRSRQFMDNDPAVREAALKRAVRRLWDDHGTEILYIIGGDGSMRAAHALWKTAQDMGYDLSVIAIPRSVDNDILWVWQSFGFASAVEWSKGFIQQLHTEAESNPRLCVIQLFGSDSGFVVTHAVTASGVCDLFLIPEKPFTIKGISGYIERNLRKKFLDSGRVSAYGVVVMAETAIPTDAKTYLDEEEVGLTDREKKAIQDFEDNHRRVYGQTPDELRSAGLKLVSRMLQKCIRQMAGGYWKDFRVFTNEPRHLIRAIPPSSSDIIFAHRLGSLAVDCGMAGYTDFMISQWLTEYVMVPLRLVTLGRKRIPEYGIFYKSACASTGQPPDLS
ncbi:MAG TPA: 6-phosphofructokinase [Pyrinomonadaceae bacterium]|nr:6-phosphofructokinase [Pyrinomonadaceae bacterium]